MSTRNNPFLKKTDLELAKELTSIEEKLEEYNGYGNTLSLSENELKKLNQHRRMILKEISGRFTMNE